MNFSFPRWSTLMIVVALLVTGLVSSAVLVSAKGAANAQLDCQVDPTEADSDGDGLSNLEESRLFRHPNMPEKPLVKTDPKNPDTDGDGLCDGEEVKGFWMKIPTDNSEGTNLPYYTNPQEEDTDGDRVSDGEERAANTDPTVFDRLQQQADTTPTPGPTLTPGPTPTSAPTPTPPPTPTPAPTPPPDLTLDSDGDGLTDGAELGGFTVTINGQDRTMVTDQWKQDTDGDNLLDGEEVGGFIIKVAGIDRTVRTDPTKPDSDGDGKSDFDEKLGWAFDPTFGAKKVVTDPTLSDTDGDGIPDDEQAKSRRDPTEMLLSQDSDGDGLTNGQELEGSTIQVAGQDRIVGTNPSLTDTDGDGLSDGAEVREYNITVNGLERVVKTDPRIIDTDNDGFSDLEESTLGIDGTVSDTDGDGIPDVDEMKGFDITVTFMSGEVRRKVYSNPLIHDTDSDGHNDGLEMRDNSDPALADTDGDGLSDKEELTYKYKEVSNLLNPVVADTDRDGLSDGLEHQLGTNPKDEDSDGDGLTDWQEVTGMPVTIGTEKVVVWSNPLSEDSDGDGLSDFKEISGHKMTINGEEETVTTNPSSTDTDADGLSDDEELRGTQITVNEQDMIVKSNPAVRDTDGDTISDGLEIHGYEISVANEKKTVKTNPMKQDTDGDGKNDDQERDGWAIAGKDSPTFETDPTLADTDGDGKNDASPEGGVTDENPVEADEGIPGLILGPLLASGIPYSATVLLIIVVGAGTYLFNKLNQDSSGDSSQRRLREQGRDLDESRRSLDELTRRSAGEIGQLRTEVDDKDRQLRQLESQLRTYEGTAQHRDQELRTAAARLAQSADELGERDWVAEIVTNLPDSNQPGNGLDDRYTVMASLGRRLDEIRGQASTQRVRARDLIADLRRLGLETDGIARALESAPATALPSLIGSLEELVRQHTVESMDKDRLLSEIQRAEGLCNREITDAVGRRVPLQFLARARELVEQATSQAEMNAAIVAGDRILDDIYRFYFPRSSR